MFEQYVGQARTRRIEVTVIMLLAKNNESHLVYYHILLSLQSSISCEVEAIEH